MARGVLKSQSTGDCHHQTPSLMLLTFFPVLPNWAGGLAIERSRFALGIAGYQGGHMDILSRVAILFSDTDEVDKLVAAQSAEELFELLNAVNED